MTTDGSHLPRYTLTIRPNAPLFVDDEICLEITARFLPRNGDQLNFDGPDGCTLVADVTGIFHYFDVEELAEPQINVEAIAHPSTEDDANELLDPVRLIEWAQPFQFVAATPSPQSVAAAAGAVDIDARKPDDQTWEQWAQQIRALRTTLPAIG
ncbi:hypothetical protein ACFWPX_33410 [Nocardia sp. NPDC058518]|uniref:hypothetical protein n=1 Tax=Nocardia sp. NPDC058518 TaxID=3346534 RepID=UPI00364A8988